MKNRCTFCLAGTLSILFLSKTRNNRSPHTRGLGVTMQQDHCRTMTGRQVMQFDSVDFRAVRSDYGGGGFSLAYRYWQAEKEYRQRAS